GSLLHGSCPWKQFPRLWPTTQEADNSLRVRHTRTYHTALVQPGARHDRSMQYSSFARPGFVREASLSLNIPGPWTWPVTALPRAAHPRSQVPARRLLAAWSERGILRGIDRYSTT